MLTTNFYGLAESRFSNVWGELICVDGVWRQITSFEAAFKDAFIKHTEDVINSPGICLLGEHNEPKLEAYTVYGVLAGAVQVSPPSGVTWGRNNGCREGTVTLGLLGLADNTVIKEVALFMRGKPTSDTNYYNFLVDLTPLDEPITINRGETKQLTYTVRLNSV